MDFGIHRGARRALAVAVSIALIGACLLSFTPPVRANTVTNFCVGTYGGGGYCNQGHFHSIWWIDAHASADAFCVMRATEGYAGAPSYGEYCAGGGSGGFVFQEFYGYGGYAQTHNRHSYEVSATPGFEYS